ncbi:Ulilysin [Arthrobotrys entomopaga]|nr:Ulilysin [Arthrobotrys entomopaga]
MNDNYRSTGIQFDLKEITRTVNKTWSSFDFLNQTAADKAAEVAMKGALRKGGYHALNIYFRDIDPGMGGIATFPEDIGNDPKNPKLILDGIQIHWRFVPGDPNPSERYNKGITAVHEVGHWFGLLHTFEGGCNGSDFVDDTPAQDIGTDGCPVGKDSCPGAQYPGLDAIHNFMDTSDDACMQSFTPGQVARMYSLWDKFRAPARRR